MAKINVGAIIDGLQKVLDAAETMMPVAVAIGGPVVANVATTVIAGVAIAQNVLERVEGVKGAISEQDEAKLREMLTKLQAVNDGLAERIADS